MRTPPRGFTLIEMLIVIAIISILGGLVLGALATARTRTKISTTEARLRLIAQALDRYEQDFTDYPPSEGDDGIKGAQALWQCLTTDAKGGPYLKKSDVPTVDMTGNGDFAIADEWRRPILYAHHSDYRNKPPNKHEYRLMSSGPDGKMQYGAPDSDDIVNWDKSKPEQE
jgi:type II secretion system protein G